MLMQKLTLEEKFRRSLSPSPQRQETAYTKQQQLLLEAQKFSAEKEKTIKMKDEAEWKDAIRKEMEQSLDQRVRDALETPPLEKLGRNKDKAKQKNPRGYGLNSHIQLDLTDKERAFMQHQQWKQYQRKRRKKNKRPEMSRMDSTYDFNFQDSLSKSNQDEFPGVFGLESTEIQPPVRSRVPATIMVPRTINSTKQGFQEAMMSGRMPDGSVLKKLTNGKYMDKYGVVRDEHGPFWPTDYNPYYGAPHFVRHVVQKNEPLYTSISPENKKSTERRTVLGGTFYDNQTTPYKGKWRGVSIIYDANKSARDYQAMPVPEDCCPSLVFESRFESGNLQQARRVGHYEYELVLQTDLYTKRHTQWYYFRIQNTQPGIIYKFRIVNLLKKDSLYNHGMQPLVYSEKEATRRGTGWIRKGHHISYARNTQHLTCPLLLREMTYHELEFQMEFMYADDTCYLAHCYPYTFTDLRDDLDAILANSERGKHVMREVMCETKVGNSCFLLTITNFENVEDTKKAVIITGRVHPGESNASWMMKGFIDFLVSDDPIARDLRDKFVFKVVPMLNPDGVIVGNYRCSLQCRDLNRNYRHPKKENFPSIWCTKEMMEKVAKNHEIILYCDMHGHSRKQNVFMYGCSSPSGQNGSDVREFLNDRIIPYLMSQKAPEKFAFNSCRFHIKRCKEATGRVVMWRQFNIYHSFTLEATFSGTTICNEMARHFTTLDLESMGRTLAEVLHEYQATRQDKDKESEVILDLTKEITQQILEMRANNALKEGKKTQKMADSKEDSTSLDSGRISDEQSDAPKANTIKSRTVQDLVISEIDSDQSRHNSAGSSQKESDGDNLEQLLDSVSKETIEGCMELLSQLNIDQAFSDGSDSSDSDSESEPEMPVVKEEVKRKKKKKKPKKREEQVRSADKKAPETKPAVTSSARSLPALRSDISNNHAKKQVAHISKNHLLKEKTYINKYEGRSNGGIPCFSEERSMERAARRIADVKKKVEDRHDFFSFYDDDLISPILHPMPPTDVSQEMRKKFQAAIEEGTANLSEALTSASRWQEPVYQPVSSHDDSNDSESEDARYFYYYPLKHSAPPTIAGNRVAMFGKFVSPSLTHRRRSLTPMSQFTSQRRMINGSSWGHYAGSRENNIQGANLIHNLLAHNPDHARNIIPRPNHILPQDILGRHSSEMFIQQYRKDRNQMGFQKNKVPHQTTWLNERHHTCE